MGQSSPPSRAMKGFELNLQNCKVLVLLSMDNALICRVKAGCCSLLFWPYTIATLKKKSPSPPHAHCSSELLTPGRAAPRRGHRVLFNSLLQMMPLVPQTALESSPNHLGGGVIMFSSSSQNPPDIIQIQTGETGRHARGEPSTAHSPQSHVQEQLSARGAQGEI